MSYAELSEALGVSLQAVKSLLVRARIGLVEAVEARDTACSEIRADLACSFDRGVRASGRSRRHLRDCPGCAEYRAQLRGVRAGFAAMSPGGPGPLAAALKLLGLGSAAGGGAASSAAGGSIVVAAGGTAAKVTAVVCCAALAAGGAAEVTHKLKAPSGAGDPAATRSAATPAPAHSAQRAGSAAAAGAAGTSAAKARGERGGSSTTNIRRSTASPTRGSSVPGAAAPLAGATNSVTGGATAPDEEHGFGHGVDGLKPNKELPLGGSVAPSTPPEAGGAAPPADATPSRPRPCPRRRAQQ